MKKTIVFLLLSTLCFAQTSKHNELVEEGKLTAYITENGSVIKVDQYIKIGFPWNKEYFTFLTQGNDKVDSKLTNAIVKIDGIKVFKLYNGFLKAYIVSKSFGAIPLYIDIESAIEKKEIVTQ